MRKSEYRRFNIEDIQPGDDYAAIRQAVQRRYEKLLTGEGLTPTLMLIDGGSGQVGAAASALAELGCRAAAARRRQGRSAQAGTRNADFRGRPRAVTIGAGTSGAASDPGNSRRGASLCRFRASREARQGRRSSRLEEISGIGPKRRKALISRFGGLQGISNAGVDQLTAVPGISRELAEKIYAALH
jgi:excinuclease ABC subunit C